MMPDEDLFEEIDQESLRPTSDEDLARLLDYEYQQSVDAHTTITKQQADGLAYYLADVDNPRSMRVHSNAGGSQMVSRDVPEVIDSLMADLNRAIMSNENLCDFEAQSRAEADWIENAMLSVNQTLRLQPDLEMRLQDWLKDGLLMKAGIGRVVTLKPYDYPEKLHGIRQDQIEMHMQRRDLAEPPVPVPDEYGTYTLHLKRRMPWRVRLEAIPPDQVYVASDGYTLDQSTADGTRYVGVMMPMTVSSAIEQWPEHRDKWIRAASSGEMRMEMTDVRASRLSALADFADWRGESGDDYRLSHNLFGSVVDVLMEWYRVDYDGDDYAELWQVVRLGRTIISKEIVQDNDLFEWLPYRIPHQFWGESEADKGRDIQDLKTSLFRALNDSTLFRARPRIAFDHQAASLASSPTMADLVRWEIGAPIRTMGPPRDMLHAVELPDVATSTLRALDYADKQKDLWTAKSRGQAALDPNSVSQESGKHLDKTLQQQNGRKEMLASNAAAGFAKACLKVLQALIRHGIQVDVKKDGKWEMISPSVWFGTPRPIVHVSAAAGSRDIEIAHLNGLFDKQERIIGIAGLDNPWVGIQELGNTLKELCNAYGFRDYERFVQRPPPEKAKVFMKRLLDSKKSDVIAKAEIEAKTAQDQIQAESQGNLYRLDQDARVQSNEQVSRASLDKMKIEEAAKTADKDREFKRWEAEKKLALEAKKLKLEEKRNAQEAQAASADSGGTGTGRSGQRAS